MIKDRIYPAIIGLLLALSVFAQGMYTEGGKYTGILFAFMIIISVLFICHLLKRGISLKPVSLIDWFVIACIPVYIISTFTAVSLWDSLFSLSRYLCCFMLYFLVKSSFKHTLLFYKILFYIGTAASAYGLYLGLTGAGFDYKKGLLLSVFRYHNASAVFFAILFFIGLHIVGDSGLLEKIVIAGCNTLLLSSVVYTQSRGMWLIFVISLIVYLILMRKSDKFSLVVSLIGSSAIAVILSMTGFLDSFAVRNEAFYCEKILQCVLFTVLSLCISCGIFGVICNRKIFTPKMVLVIAPVAALALIVFLMFFAPGAISERIRDFSFGSSTVSERTMFMNDAFEIFRRNPITGIGGDCWKYVYPEVQRQYYTVAHPHSFFAEMMTDAGVFGILLYLFMIVSFVIGFLKNKGEDKIVAKIIALVILLHSFFDFDTDYFTLLALFFVALGILSSDGSDGTRNKFLMIIPAVFIVWSVLNIASYVSYQNATEAAASGKFTPNQVYNYSKTAVNLIPCNSDYLTVHGNICRMLGNTDEKYRDEAMKVLEKAHRLNRYHFETINQLAYCYLESGDYIKACDTMKLLPYNQPFIPKSYDYLNNMFNSVSQLSVDTGDYRYADYAVAMFVEGYEHGQSVSSECRSRIEMGTHVHETYANCCIYSDMRAGRR